MDPTTGLDEIIFGSLSIVAGVLFVVFRKPIGRFQAGYYQRTAGPLRWLPRLVYWPTNESVHRWLVGAAGFALIVIGVSGIIWALIWGWPP